MYDSYGSSGGANWYVFGGTSVSSPIIASVYALAGNIGSGDYAAKLPYASTRLALRRDQGEERKLRQGEEAGHLVSSLSRRGAGLRRADRARHAERNRRFLSSSLSLSFEGSAAMIFGGRRSLLS